MLGDAETVEMPTGIVQSSRGLVHTTRADGGVESLRIVDGFVEASSPVEARPIAASGDTLIAWGSDRPRVLGLGRAGSELVVVWEHPVEVPEWSRPRPDATDDDIVVAARIVSDDVVLRWEAHTRYDGGALPPVDVEDEARRDARGVLRLSVQDGQGAREQHAEAGTSSTPHATDLLAQGDRLMSYRLDGQRRTDPWENDGATCLLVARADTPGVALRRVMGTAIQETRLTDDAAADVAVTLDGRHVLVERPEDGSGIWRAFDSSSGAVAGSLALVGDLVSALEVGHVVLTVTRHRSADTETMSIDGRRWTSEELLWSRVVEKRPTMSAPPLPQ